MFRKVNDEIIGIILVILFLILLSVGMCSVPEIAVKAERNCHCTSDDTGVHKHE